MKSFAYPGKGMSQVVIQSEIDAIHRQKSLNLGESKAAADWGRENRPKSYKKIIPKTVPPYQLLTRYYSCLQLSLYYIKLITEFYEY